MIDKELPPVVYEFESVTEALMQLLDGFPGEEFNTVPFEGSWDSRAGRPAFVQIIQGYAPVARWAGCR